MRPQESTTDAHVTLNDTPYVTGNGSGSDGKTDVTVTRTNNGTETTHLDGKRVKYDKTSDTNTRVAGSWPEAADTHVRGMIDDAIENREAREAVRANHRNFNRMLTLVFTIVIGFAVTWALNGGYFGSFGHKYAPYSFCITVLMDLGLTTYALIKHY